jgi:hypothetical protein
MPASCLAGGNNEPSSENSTKDMAAPASHLLNRSKISKFYHTALTQVASNLPSYSARNEPQSSMHRQRICPEFLGNQRSSWSNGENNKEAIA